MLKKQITVINNEFDYYTDQKLVIGDVDAYEVVIQHPEDISGCTMSVKVTMAGKDPIQDIGTTEGKEGRYTLKNNMYDTEGNITIWAAIVAEDGQTVTQGSVELKVISSGDSPSIEGNDNVPVLTQLIAQNQQLQNQYNEMIAQMGGRPVIVMNESDYMEEIAAGTYDPNGIYMVVTGE